MNRATVEDKTTSFVGPLVPQNNHNLIKLGNFHGIILCFVSINEVLKYVN